MKKFFPLLLIAGCATTPSEPTDDAAESKTTDLVAQCEAAHNVFTQRQERLLATSTAAPEVFIGAINDFQAERETLNDSHPCAAEGPAVVERNQTFKAMKTGGASTLDEATIKAVQQAATDLDATQKLLEARFATGDEPNDVLRRLASDYSRTKVNREWEAFQAASRYSDLGEAGTTCIFGRQEFDPQQEMEKLYTYVFGGDGDVHALCRVPLPASRFAGDPNSAVEILLDDDRDVKNGVLATVKLGTIEAFKETQFFRARFSLPDSKLRAEGGKSAYYHVSVRFARPQMGDETPVSDGFFWWNE